MRSPKVRSEAYEGAAKDLWDILDVQSKGYLEEEAGLTMRVEGGRGRGQAANTEAKLEQNAEALTTAATPTAGRGSSSGTTTATISATLKHLLLQYR